MKALHQILAGFSLNDAISNEALVLRDLFRSWGYASEIFCERIRVHPELRDVALDLETAGEAWSSGDIALLHLSMGSRVNRLFAGLPCRKAVRYHNVTPSRFMRGLYDHIADQLDAGIEDVRRLAGVAEVNLAVSQFNASELEKMGYRDVRVVPILLDLDLLRGQADPVMRARWADGLANILFVGRGAPNKRIEDLLYAFYYFQRYVEPRSRLLHVGSFAVTEKYHAYLWTLKQELGLNGVEFLGSLGQDQLNACFRKAHLFLCMSEHEGFCIPLLEAMAHGVPVMAYAAGAVPETLDGAGVLFREKAFDQVAEMMGRLVRPGPFREAVLAGQRARLARYETADRVEQLRRALAPLLDAPSSAREGG